MILVDNIYVDKEILTQPFLCDLEECLGACCTFYGDIGAPLTPEEVPVLQEQIPITAHLLSDISKQWIEENGVADFVAPYPTSACINKKDCVFVYYKGNSKVALCAIENCYFAGATTFRKPLSCWLYPIRVSKREGMTYLYYSKIRECIPAIKNGRKNNVKIYQILKEPLIAFLGEEWYSKLVLTANSI